MPLSTLCSLLQKTNSPNFSPLIPTQEWRRLWCSFLYPENPESLQGHFHTAASSLRSLLLRKLIKESLPSQTDLRGQPGGHHTHTYSLRFPTQNKCPSTAYIHAVVRPQNHADRAQLRAENFYNANELWCFLFVLPNWTQAWQRYKVVQKEFFLACIL